jgi:hypothetical protein
LRKLRDLISIDNNKKLVFVVYYYYYYFFRGNIVLYLDTNGHENDASLAISPTSTLVIKTVTDDPVSKPDQGKLDAETGKLTFRRITI